MSYERPKALNTVGLQLEKGRIRGVHLEQVKGIIHLIDLFSIDVTSESVSDNVNLLYITDQGRSLAKLLKLHLSVTAIESNDALIRPMFVQLKKDKDIDAVVEFQAEPILPFAQDEAIIEWSKVSVDKEGTNLSIYAVKKDNVTRHLEEWGKYDINPECISVVPAAIASFAKHFVQGYESYYIVDIGQESTTCGLVCEGKLIGAQFLHAGSENITEAQKKDSTEPIDFEQMSKEKHPHLFAALESFRLELMKNLFGLAKQLKGKELNQVFISGVGGSLPGLRNWLASELKKNLIDIEPLPGFTESIETVLQYSIPIGLALSGLPKSKDQINLRQKELAYPNPWKRLKKPIALYFLACLLLAWGAYFSGSASLGYKEDQLKEKFGALLALMNKPYDLFELEYEDKRGEGEFYSIEELSVGELYDRLDYLEDEIEQAPEPIALMPNTPRISDVLAWLATHPNVVLAGDENENRKSLIEVQNFNYSMQKRPEEKKRGNKYQVKVEFEFTSPTPKLAREFHDALIVSNDFIDAKDEVKWSSNRGRYRTSFYLKDKTYYPVSFKGRGE